MRRSPLALLLALGPCTAAAATHYQVINRPLDSLYYGRVVLCDLRGDEQDPRVDRADGGTETATLNTPLVPGDIFTTGAGRRCELEFDTGTVVLVEGGTALALETVLASSLSSSRKLTNLVLESGRVWVRYRPYDAGEVFQVLSPNAAVKIEAGTAVTIAAEAAPAATRLSVEDGRGATVLFGPDERKTRQKRLKAGSGATVGADHVFHEAAPSDTPADGNGFAAWGRARDLARSERGGDARPLPATLGAYSPAVVDFAERVSRLHGEWVWTSAKTHAWRPHSSRDAAWRPYTDGRWSAVQGMPFWVSDEPWGWVPYHLGYWLQDPDTGWVWLPGSGFAPAWVAWGGCGDAFAWWPFGPQDWTRYWQRGGYLGLPFCGANTVAWDAYPWSDNWPEPPERPQEFAKRRGGSGPPSDPPPGRPRPERKGPPRELRTMKAELDRLAERVKPEGEGGPAAWRGQPQTRPAMAANQDPADSEAPETSDPGPAEAEPAAPFAGPGPDAPVLAPYRFRDFNPDVRAARAMGGRIAYDSTRNRVSCDGCRSTSLGGGSLLGAGSSSGSNGQDAGSGAGATGAGPSAMGPTGGNGGAKAGPVDR